MAIAWKELTKAAALSGSSAIVYTAPTGTSTTIQAASANNPTAAAVVINLYRLTSGGTFNASSNRIATRTVAAGATAQFPEVVNHKLEPGSMIYADGNGCYLNLSGAESVPD